MQRNDKQPQPVLLKPWVHGQIDLELWCVDEIGVKKQMNSGAKS